MTDLEKLIQATQESTALSLLNALLKKAVGGSLKFEEINEIGEEFIENIKED